MSWTLTDTILLGVLGALALFYIYYYVRYMAGVQRRVRHQTKKRFRWREQQPAAQESETDAPEAEKMPGVSVIVCARNEADNLHHYLQALCCQKYPEFEVIVVNDRSEDQTQTVLEHYTQLFRNLRLTFVPNDAWVRSSKKLALTLAAKAAQYDYLLLTDADCRPESPYWIEEMMRGFQNEETEVVIGYGGYFEEPRCVNRLIQYDTVSAAMTFMGFAMSGHPYMGVGRNLAYRKETFFRNNGFAGLLGQRAGDDDLFVNKIATRRNTEVVVTPNSYTWSIPKHTYAEWRIQKYRHLSVSPAYRNATKWRLVAEPVVRALLYLTLIASALFAFVPALGFAGASALLTFEIVLGVWLARLGWLLILTNRAAHIFGVHGFGIGILGYDIFLPLFDLCTLIRHSFRKKKELQWN